MKQILMVVGSLRRHSFNLALAREAAGMLEGRAEVRFLDYADLPMMNQDAEFPVPEPVARVRRAVMQADGLWIFTPEYNRSYPGHLKNLLDWLSRPSAQGDAVGTTAIAGRKVCVSGVGGRGATVSGREKLTELLGFIRAEVMSGPQLGIPLEGDAFRSDTFALDQAQREELRGQVDAFLAFVAR